MTVYILYRKPCLAAGLSCFYVTEQPGTPIFVLLPQIIIYGAGEK